MPKDRQYFVLTDKGSDYRQELLEDDIWADNPIEGTKQMQKLRDFTVLEMAKDEVLSDRPLMMESLIYKPVIRRLFEAGYIDYA